MKTSHKLWRFSSLLLFSFIIIGCYPLSVDTSIKKVLTSGIELNKSPHGNSDVHFLLKNSRNGQPLDNYRMYILDAATSTLVTSAISDASGGIQTEELKNGKEYHLRIVHVNEGSGDFQVVEEDYVHEPADDPVVVETYVEREANRIGIPVVRQDPELPNGCEITTLTAVLTYHGIKTTKTRMSDDYLPKEPFKVQEGKRIGPDPHQAYAGNPRNENGGWYVFASPIVEASKKIIDDKGSRLITENVSGSSREELLSYMDQNIPVIIWVTLDLSPPVISGGWYIDGTDEFHHSFTNLHAVVLDGWKDGEVIVMDPLEGLVIHSEDEFFESYEALGSQAVIVKR